MTQMDEQKPLQEQLAQLIRPKISGNGVVLKKDGTVSEPPKEKKDGSNPRD